MQQTPIFEITPEAAIEYGKRLHAEALRAMPKEMILDIVPAEELLSVVPIEERLAGLRPEEPTKSSNFSKRTHLLSTAYPTPLSPAQVWDITR